MNCERCSACERKTIRTPEQKKAMINRLKRIEGQIRGLVTMMEEDAYCNDILQQAAAAGSALDAFSRELLASHIRSCVARDLRDGKDEVVDELLETLRRMMK